MAYKAHFEAICRLPVAAHEAFEWHARPGAFERLQPPWQQLEVLSRSGGLEDGARVVFRLRRGPVSIRWVAEHDRVVSGRQFRDVQLSGPFAYWAHSHIFEDDADDGARGSIMRDSVEYRLPLGALGRLFGARTARRELERLFRFRHAMTAADLALHAGYRDRPRLRVAVAGAGGLIGRQLCALLTTGGHRVLRLVRGTASLPGEVVWDPAYGVEPTAELEELDALVFLAGENVASGRWTERRKTRFETSRVEAVERLVSSLARLERPPAAFFCASGVSFYGAVSDGPRSEEAGPGGDFLATLAARWEQAAAAATYLGSRVVNLRFGVVLDPRGGALAKLLPAYRAGLGGVLGNGEQKISWIGLDDAVAAVLHLLYDPRAAGPVNVCAPRAVPQRELAHTLGRVLRRPLLGRLPAPLVRVIFGQLGEETLLASIEALPARLETGGFVFRHPELETALRHVLGRAEDPAS